MNKEKLDGKCLNCGAPVISEICPYCNSMTGLDTGNATMEYPVIDCKEANITFWNVVFPMIFAIGFGLFGFVFPIALLFDSESASEINGGIFIFCLPFTLIGIIAFIIGIKPIIRYFAIKRHGREIEATVYGYMNDNILLNGSPAQIVKLLVKTNDGYKFILYQLGDIKKPYEINSKIKLKVYKNIFLIEKSKQYHF